MTTELIFSKIQKAIAKMLKISEDAVGLDSSLKDDLGIDSVDGLDMAYLLEDHFKVKISDKEVATLHTVHDIVKLIEIKIAKS